MARFASSTDVSVEKSRAEIEGLIVRYGATHTAFMSAPGRAVICFEAKARRIMFELPLPTASAVCLVFANASVRRRIEMGNGLRDENGALIGGLIVFDYIQGIDDFKAGTPPPDDTPPSYDLGRQRAAEEAAGRAEVLGWLKSQEQETDARMKALLPPAAYAEYRAKMEEIRQQTPGA